jgi:lysylphosphatidylglycerol synthetase-like protein (DUF2156 family)
MANDKAEIRRPNREKPESKRTKTLVALLLVIIAVLIALITIGGWSRLEGAKSVNVFYVAVYLLFAYYVMRWNRGVLPVATALSVILIIFAVVAAPAWFDRDQEGFSAPMLPEDLLGFLTLLLIPASILLMVFAMRGFQQQWNIEAGTRAFMESQRQA